jgi:phosphatidylethanolamine-binding protein (PEBP) family uncharacterized protein
MKMKKLLALVLAFIVLPVPAASQAVVSKSVAFQAELWADNWFSLYINGKKVGEDSVPITTEKSFNSEKIKFSATYPLTIGVIAKDFTENSSGLEYIGKPNQQIGDAGIIFQIREVSTGKVVAYSGRDWKVLTVNKAPLNPECVSSTNPTTDCKYSNTTIPTTWTSSTYKDSTWKYATEFSKETVGVKDGYFDYSWAPGAALVWSSDLKLDNTILLRKVLKAPTVAIASKSMTLGSPDFKDGGNLPIDFTCDGKGISPSLSWSNVPTGAQSLAVIMDTIPGPLRPGEVDIGKHFYLTIFNIPTTVTSIAAGATNIGTFGQNFQGKKLGFTPPCSQGPGSKKYTIYLYALSSKLTITAADATENSLLAAMNGKVISTAEMNVYYSRQS